MPRLTWTRTTRKRMVFYQPWRCNHYTNQPFTQPPVLTLYETWGFQKPVVSESFLLVIFSLRCYGWTGVIFNSRLMGLFLRFCLPYKELTSVMALCAQYTVQGTWGTICGFLLDSFAHHITKSLCKSAKST